MGNLTNEMARLHGEVDALRSNRGALMRGLSRGAKDLAASVMTMRADFAAAHAAMARETGNKLKTFVSGLRKSVSRTRKENAADLAGARRAWAGKGK